MVEQSFDHLGRYGRLKHVREPENKKKRNNNLRELVSRQRRLNRRPLRFNNKKKDKG